MSIDRIGAAPKYFFTHTQSFAASVKQEARVHASYAVDATVVDPEAAVFEKSDPAAGKTDFVYAAPRTRVAGASVSGNAEFSPEEKQELEDLKKRDAEVRQHEQAHLAAAGPYAASGAAYEFEMGPDGQRYAVGGEVQIDTSPIPNDPEATVTKAKVVKKAALAPAEPSAQDYRVAAQAEQMALKARQELAAAKMEEARQPTESLGHFSQATPRPLLFDTFV